MANITQPAAARQLPDPDAAGSFCPRYAHCSSAFCPILGGSHLKDERVCLYLREAVKAGGEARVRGALPAETAEAVIASARHLLSLPAPNLPGAELRRAATTGSKLAHGERLAQSRLLDASPRGVP